VPTAVNDNFQSERRGIETPYLHLAINEPDEIVEENACEEDKTRSPLSYHPSEHASCLSSKQILSQESHHSSMRKEKRHRRKVSNQARNTLEKGNLA
jgi:hypothetical protein